MKRKRLNKKKKTKLQKFLKKHFKNFKVYWYPLDIQEMGVHFFRYGFEISLFWYNLIVTWGEE